MEVVRQFIDADKLMSIIQLPKAFQDSKLEVIVLPVEEINSNQSKKNENTINVNNIVDSLIGIIPDNGMTLEDYREERLSKYETIN